MTITGLGRSQHRGAGWRERITTAGTARTGCAVRVVDEDGRDLPPGEPGEIITRSDCVMAGYLDDPAATAKALREGWLWTGDVGSLDAHGYLTLRDRSKDLIISGGSNVYPREVEEVLLRHDAVAEAAVVGRAHQDWGEEVVAFVVPAERIRSRGGGPRRALPQPHRPLQAPPCLPLPGCAAEERVWQGAQDGTARPALAGVGGRRRPSPRASQHIWRKDIRRRPNCLC